MREDPLWWQRGVIYQVYPRSFQDSDGDGIGDLPGLTSRLDHLRWLGVDALWISPIYPSPMADFGYDVSDQRAVHPLFGTLDDFDRLLDEAHARDLRVILDLVPNHTSDRHPWFQDSRSSREAAKRDWYLWADPAPGGGPPNNWLSVFGGSAWEWDEATGQYYHHAFLKEQPDLNWRSPEVQEAMLNVMRFWLDRGVDGFRVDVLWHLVKDAKLRSNPPNPAYRPGDLPYDRLLPVFSTDQPEVHEIVSRMRRLVDGYGERVLIGEIYLPVGKLVAYYGRGDAGAHLPMNLQLLQLPWEAAEIYAAIGEYEGSLPLEGWPNWVLGNHDKARVATRVGAAQAPVAAMLLLTLRGTPTLYYGDEIGMPDVLVPPGRGGDPQGENLGREFSRDPQRAPMRWSAGPHAGFTTGEPWLPVGAGYREANVASQREDPSSLLCLHGRLLALRRREEALQLGDYVPVGISGSCFAYLRVLEGRRVLVAANLGHGPGIVVPEHQRLRGRVVLGTDRSREGGRVEGTIELQGDEGFVAVLDS